MDYVDFDVVKDIDELKVGDVFGLAVPMIHDELAVPEPYKIVKIYRNEIHITGLNPNRTIWHTVVRRDSLEALIATPSEHMMVVKIRETPFHEKIRSEVKNSFVHLCDHSSKYVNSAGGIGFWYCPQCKQDLGNV